MDAGEIKFDSASKINDEARQRIRKGIGAPGDVLISHKGTIGKVAQAPSNAPPYVCSPQTTFWRVLDTATINVDYLYALMRSPEFQALFAVRAGETDMAGYVSLTSQRQLDIPVPPPSIQLSIAEVIGALDGKIKLNRQTNETLEALARALFKDWFVDFGPTRAKAEHRAPYLAPELWDLFPDRLDHRSLCRDLR